MSTKRQQTLFQRTCHTKAVNGSLHKVPETTAAIRENGYYSVFVTLYTGGWEPDVARKRLHKLT